MGNSVATVVAGTALVLLAVQITSGGVTKKRDFLDYSPPRPTRSYAAGTPGVPHYA